MRRKARWALPLLLLIPACSRQTTPVVVGDELGRYQVQASLMSNACGEGHPAPVELNFLVDLGHLAGSTRGFWKLPDGPQIDGTLERAAGFRFEQSTQVIVVPRDTTMNIPGCTIERREVVNGVLEARVEETPDGGASDAGPADAGSDAGLADAGSDAGPGDSGFGDSGLGDAGLADASVASDAGIADASVANSTASGETALSGSTTVTISAVPGGNCTALLAVYGGPFPTVPCDIEYQLRGVRVGPTP